MLDLAHIRALADAATDGPWELVDFNEGSDPPQPLWGVVNPPYYNPLDHPDEKSAEVEVRTGCRADAEFIAAARELVPAMADEIERLRREVADKAGCLTSANKRANKLDAWLHGQGYWGQWVEFNRAQRAGRSGEAVRAQ